jgi:hypothetical protein
VLRRANEPGPLTVIKRAGDLTTGNRRTIRADQFLYSLVFRCRASVP